MGDWLGPIPLSLRNWVCRQWMWVLWNPVGVARSVGLWRLSDPISVRNRGSLAILQFIGAWGRARGGDALPVPLLCGMLGSNEPTRAGGSRSRRPRIQAKSLAARVSALAASASRFRFGAVITNSAKSHLIVNRDSLCRDVAGPEPKMASLRNPLEIKIG